MKKDIEYYYSLKIDKIIENENEYIFKFNNYEYILSEYLSDDNSVEFYIRIINELRQKNIFVFDIVKNNYGKYISSINEKNYILIKGNNLNKQLSIIEIKDFLDKTIINANYNIQDWSSLWQIKIDYIENQLNEVEASSIIKYSIDYYIGIIENAIYYFNNIKKEIGISEKKSLSHKRVDYPNLKKDYYNPLSFILDYRVRDIAEYLKKIFYRGENPIDELNYYLKVSQLSNIECNLLFIRLLYPSEYIDEYEQIINYKKNPDHLLEIINMNEKYEEFLKKAYNEISLYASLEKIDWLIY